MRGLVSTPSAEPTFALVRPLRHGCLLVTFCLLALAFSSSAQAALVHPFLPSRSLDGSTTPAKDFDKACGLATDSEGDVYVASANNSAIDVFDPSGKYLATIANANKPCGLAVDSKGRLYVSESATGKVVRYTPSAYPFTGILSYGAPTTVDASGKAKGIAVDKADDRLYVAKGDRIDTYRSDGVLGENEVQRVSVEGTSGTFSLSFGGKETAPLPHNASHAEVDAALEGLESIGAGNVSVGDGPSKQPKDHFVTFEGALASANVEPIAADASGLEGTGSVVVGQVTPGFDGHIGDEGELSEATGVAAYTYGSSNFPGRDHYVFVADAAGEEIRMIGGLVRETEDGGQQFLDHTLKYTIGDAAVPGGFGFGVAGAQLAVDPKNGHVFFYDAEHEAVVELEASGQFFTRVEHASFADAEPTAVAVDRSGGPNEGAVYVSSGAGPGAEALAFGPLPAPSHTPLPKLTFKFNNACGTVVDSNGYLYVAGGQVIRVYNPASPSPTTPLTSIIDENLPCDLAVDSEGNLYARDDAFGAPTKVVKYVPDSFPPVAGTKYGPPQTIVESSGFQDIRGIAVNPANDHLFVVRKNEAAGIAPQVFEYDSSANGSGLLNDEIGKGTLIDPYGVDVHGPSGNVYVTEVYGGNVYVFSAGGAEVLATIDGSGGPHGPFPSLAGNVRIAVDQSNGHVFLATPFPYGTAQEYEASGAFVSEFASFAKPSYIPTDIAVDNSGGPNDGNVYFAYGDNVGPDDLSAFGPLAYGEPPVAVTGPASGVDAGEATLSGTVDPRGFLLEGCHFEYVAEDAFEAEGFSNPEETPCEQSAGEIGEGIGPVPVHAEVAGLDPEERYRFRLVAVNSYGQGNGQAGLFGPPVLTTKSALPVLYTEATLRATVDPSGLPTTYHVEYGTSEAYGSSTPGAKVPLATGPVEVAVPLFGLIEGATYHYRIVAGNEAGTVAGPDQTLTTLERSKTDPDCPNAELRIGASANLPDCRAYELVSPADTRGLRPEAVVNGSDTGMFNNWLITPRGRGAGNSAVFFTEGTLPGTEGNGRLDAHRAQRGKGGWSSTLFSPSAAQASGVGGQGGVSSDHGYSFWEVVGEGTLPVGGQATVYLRTPQGFELLGEGQLGTDVEAGGRFIAPEGSHVIFSSDVQLEVSAAPTGTGALYDRTSAAVGTTTHVVSLKPDGTSFGTGEGALYQGTSEDGSAVAFEVGGALYARVDNEKTVQVAAAPATFAGFSADGERIFYANANLSGTAAPADLFAFDLSAETSAEIASNSRFLNVSADGSHVYLTSTERLDQAEKGTPGANNLYAWDGAGIDFVAILDPKDLEAFNGRDLVNLARWANAIGPNLNGIAGRANAPSRSTPDGSVFIFSSHADLTEYQSEGSPQIYRYEATDGSLLCVSCNPGGASASKGGALQETLEVEGAPTVATTLIPNVTDDGEAIFFESLDVLLPGDSNSSRDVYEWRAEDSGSCRRPGGCLYLISSGQSDTESFLYGMTPDGHDVFFATDERLLGRDAVGSRSIYDARVSGGFAESPLRAPCEGDACQGQGSDPSTLPSAASVGLTDAGNVKPRPRCAKGKRRVVRRGKARCVEQRKAKKQRQKRRHHRRSAR